jgi:redox-sensitive bicupin YhaK (pirin superfamily)
MEIISIPLEGDLEHQDSTAPSKDPPGDVQVMSAGTGITHSEKMPAARHPLSFCRYGYSPIKRM